MKLILTVVICALTFIVGSPAEARSSKSDWNWDWTGNSKQHKPLNFFQWDWNDQTPKTTRTTKVRKPIKRAKRVAKKPTWQASRKPAKTIPVKTTRVPTQTAVHASTETGAVEPKRTVTASVSPIQTEAAYEVKTPFGVNMTLKASVSTAALPAPLKVFLGRVQSQCEGFRVISACRPGAKVKWTNKSSLHASCKAADYQVKDPDCAFRLAAGFSGGHSNDYYNVGPNHFHASYAPGSREWGRKFAHYKGPARVTQYATRNKAATRYAVRSGKVRNARYARRNGRGQRS